MFEFLEKINKFVCIYRGRIILLSLIMVLLTGFHDVIFDLTITVIHTLFEWVEYALEELIERIFHTTRKQTQTIVFYLILSVGAYLCYRLGLKAIDLYYALIIKITDLKAVYKARMVHKWNRLSPWQKIKLVLSGSAGIGAVVFFSIS